MVDVIEAPNLPEEGKLKIELTDKQLCEAQGGIWDGKKCRFGFKETTATQQKEIPRTPREQAADVAANLRAEEVEKRRKIERDKEAAKTALDVPFGGGGALGDIEKIPKADEPKQEEEKPTTDTQIVFNKDGTIGVSRGGVSEVLTKEEYKVYSGGAGMLTDKVKRLREAPSRAEMELQQAIGQLGQIGHLDPVIQADVNRSQALMAGLIGVLPGAAAGAIGFVGGPWTGILTTVAGAVGGLITGYMANVKTQLRGELGAAKEELNLGTFAMRQFAMQASKDPANADYWIGEYNNALTRIHQAYRQVKAETAGDLNAWIEDGRVDLARIEVFIRPGGKADIYKDKIIVALQTGVPLEISGEDLVFAESIR